MNRSAQRRGAQALLAALSLTSSLLVLFPYRNSMDVVYRHWDSPVDLTVAKTLYRIPRDNPLVDKTMTATFFASRLPLYPLLVRAFAWIGYERAMLFVSLAAGVAAVLLFYALAADVWRLSSPFFLSLVFLFLPPRWLLYRSVGATESLYMALTLASLFLFERGRIGRASAAATLASVTRITGLMIAPAYLVVLWRRGRVRSLPWILVIVSGFLLYGVFCAWRFGDFFAYFEPHLGKIASPYPFANLRWLFDIRQVHLVEFHILLAFAYVVGITRLRPYPVLLSYCAFQFLLLVCIGTEDWSRYFLSMAPFALVVGYREVLDSRAVRWILPVFVVLSFYYARHAIPLNGCPVELYRRLLDSLGVVSSSGL
jgi:hypothetical protein